MSTSSVVTGAPSSTPAVIPTTMNSTRWATSCFRISAKRALFIQLSDLERGFDELLQPAQALLGGQVEHPPDLRPIDAVLVASQLGERLRRGSHTDSLHGQGQEGVIRRAWHVALPRNQVGASTSATSTDTRRVCEPPPITTPRRGVTSPKSRPQAAVTCLSSGMTSLVGSSSSHP